MRGTFFLYNTYLDKCLRLGFYQASFGSLYSSAFSDFCSGRGLPRPSAKPLVPSGILGPGIGLFNDSGPELPDMDIKKK
jgi:hypothetical protein